MSNGDDFYDEGYTDDARVVKMIEFPDEKSHGRESELGTLHRMYAKFLQEREESLVAIIRGEQGVGKSKLVKTFIQQVVSLQKTTGTDSQTLMPPIVISEKFDDLQTANPFSWFAGAFEDVRTSGREGRDDNTAVTQRSAGGGASGLTSLIPSSLAQVIGNVDISLTTTATSADGRNRRLYLIHKLMKTLCDGYHLIMFMDDLQWADDDSMELLVSLVKDPSLSFFFIGVIREEGGISACHPETKLLKAAIPHKLETINLSNFSRLELSTFVAEILELEVEDCHPLSDFIYTRTEGNILYTIQIIQELERRSFLFFCMMSFQWSWNLAKANMSEGLSSSLDDAIFSKIRAAPAEMQSVLKVASYLRSAFTVSILHELMLVVDTGNLSRKAELTQIVDNAVVDGILVNRVGSPSYCFAHDSMQQAAFALVQVSDRNELRRKIGMRLFELAHLQDREDWIVFVAADHLNSCLFDESPENSRILAKINLLCGEQAVAVAAVSMALAYFLLALKKIRKIKQHWKEHYQLSLRVIRGISDVEFCLGNYNTGKSLTEELLKNAVTFKDRLPSLLSLATSLGRQNNHIEAYELLQKIANQMDPQAVPKRLPYINFVKDSFFVRRSLQRLSDYDILLKPIMKNSSKLAVAECLAESQMHAYFCGDVLGFSLCALRGMKFSFKHGLCPATCYFLAGYALLVNDKVAIRLSHLSRRILDRMDSTIDGKAHEARALTIITYSIDAWYCAREKVLQTGYKAHTLGMMSGNYEVGFLNWVFATNFAYATGFPLGPIEKTGREIIDQLHLYNVESIVHIFTEVRFPLIHLLGIGSNRSVIQWDAIESYDPGLSRKTDIYQSIFGLIGRLETAVYFGKHAIAVRLGAKLEKFMVHGNQYAILAKQLFYPCLALTIVARSKRGSRSKFLSKAISLQKEMEKLSRSKGLNAVHKSLIMKANILAASSTPETSRLTFLFDEGILSAAKIGYIQDAALASELAGDFFIDLDSEKAGLYYRQSLALYLEWGAQAKIVDLQRRRGYFLRDASSSDSLWFEIDTAGQKTRTGDYDELLSHQILKTEQLHVARITAKDEISILTDPSE